MPLIVVSCFLYFFVIGCSTTGLERSYYPASQNNIIFTGTVIDYQPYRKELGETKESRAMVGFLTGGLVGVGVSTINTNDIGKSEALEYSLRDKSGQIKKIVSIKKVELLECVDVYGNLDETIRTIIVTNKEKC